MRRLQTTHYRVVFRDGTADEEVPYPHAHEVPYSEAHAQQWATALVAQLRTAGITARIHHEDKGT